VATLQADASDMFAKIAETKALLEDLSKTPTEVTITANAAEALAAMAAARTNLNAMALPPITFTVAINSAEALAELAVIRAIAGITIPVDANIAPLVAKMAVAKAAAATQGGDTGVIGSLLWGRAGIAGFAAFGTIASLAGFGFEHALTTMIGLAGSLAGALGGLAVLAVGVFGKMAVGMGSDMLVMKSTIADTQLLSAALTAVQTAQLTYGKNSAQAAAATQALNVQMALLGNTAGVQAELGLAKAGQALNSFWDQATSAARVAAVGFIQPFFTLAYTYIPLIAAAATRNFTLMTAAFKPFIAWATGPGVAIFTNLENLFAAAIPTGVNALTQFVELLAKVANWAAPQTGSLMQSIDTFLTNLNSASGFANLEGVMTTMIGMFHDWWDLLKQIGITIFDVFSQGVGLGKTIVTTITAMLVQLDKWLTSTSGVNAIHTLFSVHLAEIQALLAVLPTLIGAFGQVYLAIAPVLTLIAAGLAVVVGWMLKIPVVGPILAWAAAIGLLWSRMNLLAAEVALVKTITAIYTAVVALPGAFLAWAAGAETAATATVTLGAATDATKAATTGVGAQLSSLMTPIGLVTLGIEALAVGAAVLILNWGSLSQAIWNLNNPLQAARKALAAFDQEAAKNYLTYLTNNFQQFSDAVTTLARGPIATDLPNALVNLESKYAANSQAIAKLNTDTANFVNAGNKFANAANGITSAEFAAAKNGQVWNTVAGDQILGLQQLSSGFNALNPVMQGVINNQAANSKGVDAAIQIYRAFNQVLPQTILTNSQLRAGISQTTLDFYAAITALTTLAAKQTGPEHAATMLQIADLKAVMQAQAARYNAALPQWNAEVLAYTNIALAQGKSATAAAAWAAIQAGKVDPAGAAAQAQIQLYANSLHTSLANAEALVNANPAILQAWINQQNTIKNNIAENTGLYNSLSTVVRNVYALIAAINRLNSTPINIKTTGGYIPGLAGGGIVNADASGTVYALHGTEAVIPKNLASPSMWEAIKATLSGRSSPAPMTLGASGGGTAGRGGAMGAGASISVAVTNNFPAGTSAQMATQVGAATEQAVLKAMQKVTRQMRGGARTYGFMPG